MELPLLEQCLIKWFINSKYFRVKLIFDILIENFTTQDGLVFLLVRFLFESCSTPFQDTNYGINLITRVRVVTIIGAEFQQPITANFDNNQCVACHRPQCTTHFQNYPLDELVMPAPFQDATNFDHSNISNTDRQAIRDWCATLGL